MLLVAVQLSVVFRLVAFDTVTVFTANLVVSAAAMILTLVAASVLCNSMIR